MLHGGIWLSETYKAALLERKSIVFWNEVKCLQCKVKTSVEKIKLHQKSFFKTMPQIKQV